MNSTTLIERIEFQAVAPNRALPGLDTALHKLEALGTALNAINQRLASVTTLSAFKRTTKGIEDSIKQLESRKGKGLSLKQVANSLGLPTEDLRQYILRVQESITQDIAKAEKQRNKLKGTANASARADLLKEQRAMEAELKNVQNTFSGSGMRVRSAPAAARVISAYQKQAMDEVRSFSHAQAATLQSLLGGGGVGNIDIGAIAQAKVKAESGKSESEKKAKKKARTSVGEVPDDATLVETKTIKVSEQPDRIVRRYEDPKGNIFEHTEVEGTNVRLVERDRMQRRAEKDLKGQLAALKADAGGKLKGVNNAAGIGAFRQHFTAQAKALLEGADGQRYVEAQLEPLVDAFIGQTLPGLIQKQIVQNGKVSQRLRQAGQKNIKQQQADAKNIQRQRAAEAKQTGVLRASSAQADLNEVATQAILSGPSIEQMQAEDAAKAAKTGGGGRTPPAPQMDAHVAEYQQAQKEAKKLADEQARLAKQTELLSGNFVQNTVKVAAWTASVAILYGSLGLLQHGFMRTVEIGAQTARLDQVFTQVGGSTQALTGDILHLAAVTGRSTDEAMQAAIQWSRMGLSRKQVNEAVRQSLVATNVAEMTAAEATDHLQAVMRNYGLQVNQLGSFLGELNQISNTYNVTNEEMLTGLSRTATAAKQAGMPLQELMGIIGATVGATKQSGANIGNAFKSIILALSNPELQEKLRLQFKFESTTGGEGLKDMSTMLGDLYVRYEKLVAIERQSMLFNVAGKTQANRLAAILDNYVRAQVLAINAQLHLNSAEQENEKITGTLKAQLTSVIAEWEKFVVVQSNRGPVQVLTETAKALRGVMSLMNTGGGSWLTTAMLGLAGAASARALVSGFTAKGNGFLGRSGGVILREAGALNAAATGTIWNFLNRPGSGPGAPSAAGTHRGPGGGLVPGSIGPSPFDPAKLGPLSKFVFLTNSYGDAALRVAKNSATAGPAVRALFTAFGAGLKAISLATVALAEFAVPLLIIAGGVWAFNRSLDALGVTSDRAETKLSGISAEMERAHAAAGAMTQAVRLMTTAQDALSTRQGAMPDDEVKKLIRGVAEVSYLDEQDVAKKERQTDELEKQLLLLHQQKNVAGIQEAISARIAATQEMRRRQMQMEVAAQVKSIATYNQEIARIKAAQNGAFSWMGAETRNKNLTEKEAGLAEAQGRKHQLIQDIEEGTNDELEKRLAYNEKHLSALERERVMLESIAAIYDQIRTSTPMDRAVVQSAKLATLVMAETANIERLQKHLQDDKPGQAARDKKAAELREKLGAVSELRADEQAGFANTGYTRNAKQFGSEFLSALGQMVPGLGGNMPFAGGNNNLSTVQRQSDSLARLQEYDRQIKQLQADLKAAMDGTLPGMAGQDDVLSTNRQMSQSITNRQKMRVEKAGLDSGAGLREQATRFGLGQQRGGITSIASEYGYNDTDKNLRSQEALQRRINELQEKQNRTAEEYGELTDAIARKRELEVNQLTRYQGILRDINQLAIENNKEMLKSFMSAGPAEMLRKLAAFRMAQRGPMSQGQFFGMGPGMREDFGKFRPEWSPEGIQLNREKGQAEADLKNKGQMNPDGSINWDAVNTKLMKFTDLLAESMKGLDAKILAAISPDALTTAFKTATASLDQFGPAVNRATQQLVDMASRLEKLYTAAPEAGSLPRLPQAGGVGGGVGFGF